jgi:hypothetical protein
MRIILTMLLMVSLAQAQGKTIPEQGPPPKNLAHRPDGRFSANGDPANPEKFEIYTVKTGDTLSNIAAQQMKNARLWPQLWEQNEHIVNPHWIYPNDKILIKPVTVITEAAPPPAPTPEPVAEPTPPPPPPAPEPPTRVMSPVIAAKQPAPPAPRPTAIFDIRPRNQAPEIKPTDVYCAGFVHRTPITSSITVSAKYNSDGSGLAAQGDYVYLNRLPEDGIKPGDKLQVIRPTHHVEALNGGTKAIRDLGMHYLDVAQIQVMQTQRDFALARVTTVCEAIELGDILIPFERFDVPVLPRNRPFSPFMQAAGGISGDVVITKNVLLNFGSAFRASGIIPHSDARELAPLESGIATPGNIVYVDLGKSSGVKSGDVFIVYRDLDVDSQLYRLPHEAKGVKRARTAIGEVVIVKVDEAASSALVTYSSVGISAGDYVERR